MSLFLGEITSPCSAISLSGNKYDSCCRLSGGSNIRQKTKINQKMYKIKQIVHVKVLLKVLVTIEFMLTKVSRESATEEVSFKCSHHRVSTTNSKE